MQARDKRLLTQLPSVCPVARHYWCPPLADRHELTIGLDASGDDHAEEREARRILASAALAHLEEARAQAFRILQRSTTILRGVTRAGLGALVMRVLTPTG